MEPPLTLNVVYLLLLIRAGCFQDAALALVFSPRYSCRVANPMLRCLSQGVTTSNAPPISADIG